MVKRKKDFHDENLCLTTPQRYNFIPKKRTKQNIYTHNNNPSQYLISKLLCDLSFNIILVSNFLLDYFLSKKKLHFSLQPSLLYFFMCH